MKFHKLLKLKFLHNQQFYKHVELDQVGANIEKAKTLLQWTPKRPLKQMIEDEWRFYQNTLNGR